MASIEFLLPFGPLLMVAGGLWLFGKLLPSRAGIIATVAIACGAYLEWRIVDTVPWSGGFAQLWWPLICMAVETAAMFDAAILLMILARPTDRSAEADAGEARLRALWAQSAEALPPVDVFIATYNEPREVLEKTIVGCLALDWPDARVWVLDDGRRAWVRDLCLAKGAGYINRPDNKGAKAGNINHAITQTTAPFIAVFDADFIPQRDFLLRTMGFFDEAKVGIVQIPHSFYNNDPMQTNLGLEEALPDDQRFFFEAIMPGRDGWDAAFCCGSNSVTRRTLFEDIGGGLPEGSITEDMLLTMASLRQGYVTRYLNEPLAFGLAPESAAAFFVQRQRWAQGAVQILYLKQGPLGPGLALKNRLLFLPTAWIFQGLACLYTMLGPLLFALFNLSPMVAVDLPSIVSHVLPMALALIGGITLLAPGKYYPLSAQILTIFQTFRILPVVLKTLVQPRGHAFKVTPKGSAAGQGQWESKVLAQAMGIMAASALALVVNLSPDHRIVSQDGLMPVVAFWLTVNIVMLFFVAMMCLEKPRRRKEERFPLAEKITLMPTAGGALVTCDAGDISLSGVGLRVSDGHGFSTGDRVRVIVPQVGAIPGFVRRTGQVLGIEFEFPSDLLRDRLTVALFTRRIPPKQARMSLWSGSAELLKRLWTADLRLSQGSAEPEPAEPAAEKLAARTLVLVPDDSARQRLLAQEPAPTPEPAPAEDQPPLRAIA